jgi:hypothetical protein
MDFVFIILILVVGGFFCLFSLSVMIINRIKLRTNCASSRHKK